ncbi:MAG: hypothetical protein ACREKF_00820 [Candidatus Methylomirabilales bacterium]
MKRPTLQRLYPSFVQHYLSATLVLAGALEDDPQRMGVLASPGFAEAHRTLTDRGAERIGREATTAALMGLDTMARIGRRALRGWGQAPRATEDVLHPWASIAFASMLSILAVTSLLSRDEQLRGGAGNATVLAYWSKGYAVNLYDLSNRLGLLQPAPPLGPLPEESDEEDTLLSQAREEDYLKLLADEDSGNAGAAR